MHTGSTSGIGIFTLTAAVLLVLVATPLAADTTITYQGQLQQNNAPHTGPVEMSFTLWNADSGGNQLGPELVETVAIDQGLFQVDLDFGSVFGGGPVWLQVEIGDAFLNPRQPIRAVPVAIAALSGGTGSSPWALAGGLLSYGDVVAIGGDPAEDNLIVTGGLDVERDDIFAHAAITGRSIATSTGLGVGVRGVNASTNGSGVSGGSLHPGGTGVSGGSTDGTGVRGTALGTDSVNHGVYGLSNSDDGFGVFGTNISEFGTGVRAEGYNALWADGEYGGVTAFGDVFGSSSIGDELGLFASGQTGVESYASVVDGYSAYFFGVDGSRNYFEHAVGVGTLEPEAMLHIVDTTGDSFPQYLRITDGTDIKFAVFSNGIILGPGTVGSSLYLDNYLTGGQTSVCKQTAGGNPAVGYLAQCSSSARYKKDIETLGPVGDLVSRLRPVSYRWIDSGIEEIGLVAEEVAEVEPRLATYNAEGQIEGVRYRQLAALLVGALQEQQAEIAELKADTETLEGLKADNAALAARLARLESLINADSQLAMEE